MPKFLEQKLKKEYPNNPGAVYGTMNKLGYMKGSKETKKGKKAEAKHEAKTKVLEDYRDKKYYEKHKTPQSEEVAKYAAYSRKHYK